MSYMPDSQWYNVNCIWGTIHSYPWIKALNGSVASTFSDTLSAFDLEHVVHTISGIVKGCSPARTIKTGIHVRNFLGVQLEAEYIEIQVWGNRLSSTIGGNREMAQL